MITRSRADVAIEVDLGMGMVVAGQELANPQGSRAMVGPDEHGVPEAAIDQLRPAENEGTHQDVAQLGVGLNDGEEMLPVDLDHLTRSDGADANHGGLPRQGADLAR